MMERNLKNQFKKQNNHIFLMGKRFGQFPSSKEDIHMASKTGKDVQRKRREGKLKNRKLRANCLLDAKLVPSIGIAMRSTWRSGSVSPSSLSGHACLLRSPKNFLPCY